MNAEVVKLFNDQIQAEFYSAYMYLQMSIEMESKNFKGMARWLYLQYEEERQHALKLAKFMQDRGVKPQLLTVEAPPAEYGTPLELFKKVLAHEKYVTARVNTMYEAALAAKDYPAQNCLRWYIDEQVEEEANASEIVEKLQMVGDQVAGLFAIDGQLGARK